MKRWLNARITLAMAAALAVALVLAAANPATAPPRDAPPSVAPINEDVVGAVEDAAPGGAGLRVYLDPATGLLRNRPTDPEAEEIIRDAAERLNRFLAAAPSSAEAGARSEVESTTSWRWMRIALESIVPASGSRPTPIEWLFTRRQRPWRPGREPPRRR